MENHKREVRFISQSIAYSMLKGILVGVVVGIVVSLFRLAIEYLFKGFLFLYRQAHSMPLYMVLIFLIYMLIAVIVAQFIDQDPDIKGSGIPQVEAELKGLIHLHTWRVLLGKFVGGVLAIASGLMLGREGPSIQLGAATGKGIGHWLKAGQTETRSLIASGAAAGLSAAFNAPIAGLLFVVEEVYHHFSRLVWVTALVASLTANFVSLNIFGQTPVLKMSHAMPDFPLTQYWMLILLGIFLGAMGWVYEKAVLNIGKLYQVVGENFHLRPAYYSIFAFFAIIPIGYVYPNLLGGGNHLIVSIPDLVPTLGVLVAYFFIRFVWSMLSYGSGLPGGIFLPILTLGSLLGMIAGRWLFGVGLIGQGELTLFVVLGMAGYFAAISKAPLTAILLVTEMVGDLSQLMPLAVVSIIAYIVMDMMKGEPVYEAMLERLLPHRRERDTQMTLMEVVVNEKLANKRVRDLTLPENTLITSQILNGQATVVKGNTRLVLGASIFVAVPVTDIAAVRELLGEKV